MKTKLFLLFFLAAAGFFTACQKEVTGIKLPESSSKLIVTSFISPQDTAVHVRITRSVPTLGVRQPADAPVTDASVWVTDGTQTANLEFDSKTATYLVETAYFPVTAGATYTLRVTTPDGGQAEATCTVPAALNVPLSVTLDSASVPNNIYKEYTLRLSWPDSAGETNYYRAGGEIAREFTRQSGNGPVPPNVQPLYWDSQEVIEDRGQNGSEIYTPKLTVWGFGSPMVINIVLHAYLLHTDQHYYEYHRSVRSASYSQDNPFAEPVLVYSNITGGLGVFAAYNRSTLEVKLK
jgi:hypothetical protein